MTIEQHDGDLGPCLVVDRWTSGFRLFVFVRRVGAKMSADTFEGLVLRRRAIQFSRFPASSSGVIISVPNYASSRQLSFRLFNTASAVYFKLSHTKSRRSIDCSVPNAGQLVKWESAKAFEDFRREAMKASAARDRGACWKMVRAPVGASRARGSIRFPCETRARRISREAVSRRRPAAVVGSTIVNRMPSR